ncbi:MAG TPA: hypothetical protein VGM56_02800 [Byssovorax sp.]
MEADVVHGDGVRVVDARRGARLAHRPLGELGRARSARGRDPQRDAAIELLVDRGEDLPHAARPEDRLDAVAAEHVPGLDHPRILRRRGAPRAAPRGERRFP